MKKPEMTLTQIAKNILQKNRELLEDQCLTLLQKNSTEL